MRIVNRSAGILRCPSNRTGAVEIARRSRGTPRIANRLLRRVRDFAQVKAKGIITRAVADQALCAQGVDARGLDELDRKLLRTIIDFYQGGPVGVEALAATLNEESDTLVDMVEPFLLKIGFPQPHSERAQSQRLRLPALQPDGGRTGTVVWRIEFREEALWYARCVVISWMPLTGHVRVVPI